jgi:hypothetical protein
MPFDILLIKHQLIKCRVAVVREKMSPSFYTNSNYKYILNKAFASILRVICGE